MQLGTSNKPFDPKATKGSGIPGGVMLLNCF